MTELTKDDKERLWNDINNGWDVIKGNKSGDIATAKESINKAQNLLGLEVTDWEKREEGMKNPQIASTKDEPYTDAQAEEIYTEAEIKTFEKATDKALALRNIIANFVKAKDKELAKNPAGTGQIVNIAIQLLQSEKKNGKTEKK
ncbi:MAG: hypothetical protein V3V41_00205 [Candidatus Heimdallarchaeota archaeon]